MLAWLDNFRLYSDNVILHLDGVLYLRVVDPFKVGRHKSHFNTKGKSFHGVGLIDLIYSRELEAMFASLVSYTHC